MTSLLVSLDAEVVAMILADGQTVEITDAGATVSQGAATVVHFPRTVISDPAVVTATVPDGVPRERLRWVDGNLVVIDPPDPPPRVPPPDISRLQLALGLASAGLITADEAEDFGPGNAIPDAFLAVINSLPSDQRVAARIKVSTFTTAARDDALVEALAAAEGISQAAMDDYWRAWGALT